MLEEVLAQKFILIFLNWHFQADLLHQMRKYQENLLARYLIRMTVLLIIVEVMIVLEMQLIQGSLIQIKVEQVLLIPLKLQGLNDAFINCKLN